MPVSRVERLLTIHRALKAGRRCTATELARDLGVHVRTIYRDVDFLRDELAAPLVAQGNRGYRYSDLGYVLPDLTLTEGELLAFLVAERVVEGYAHSGAPFVDRLRQGLQKLAGSLGAPIPVALDDLAERRHRYDPGALGAVSHVRLRLSPRAASRLRERPGGMVRETDGSVVLTLQAPLSQELLSWILAQGREARVLHPQELVERVRDEVREMASLY